jgi:hypothetical protein
MKIYLLLLTTWVFGVIVVVVAVAVAVVVVAVGLSLIDNIMQKSLLKTELHGGLFNM